MLRKPARVALALMLALAFASPASALLYTVDFSGDGILQLDGSDDLPFDLDGGGTDGKIRAVDIFSITAGDIASTVGTVNFATQDVLVFDIASTGSLSIDELGVSIDPMPFQPVDGAGTLTGPGVAPSSITILPGFFSSGEARFGFASPNFVDPGENSVRLFVAYPNVGDLELGDVARFMVSSGVYNQDFTVSVVPEPSTLVLLGGGLAAAGWLRRRRSRRAH